MATATAVQITSDGIGPTSPLPKTLLNVSSRIGCGAESVIHCAVPWAIPSIPSVTRNDGMPRPTTSEPLIAPTVAPSSSPATIPAASP